MRFTNKVVDGISLGLVVGDPLTFLVGIVEVVILGHSPVGVNE